ncbi:Na+/H+ antiporter NhaA [Aequorivita vladivostokensis]|uniref:Na(+)/H(+) antiporter NhaA n=1 Tax=Aequorivita vladivostokensis TaxID=171194 RepID=A0ABR5DGQ2_9FLAO|nr:Na+/H+ antiporter NhaA [Aequorivita vladivostokensis]KJJ37975.1 Na(+)/H(+) antiporter NhaA [Aequorivita vladivostokensis]MAB58521.1 Na+/H+ antiporter NhaA [Aequorivita sp.]MBF29566.1 Na+/H+ antiporter NhaA [Aequorivita sp.]|tara:strand:+ start:257375 stop:258697 length:1323 start_codon:yes stop_codon:yes gene_type:complete
MIKEKILSPFQKFVNLQSSTGILLLATTIIALVWANSAFSESYQSFWQYEIGIVTDSFELVKPLILWVNDGLMSIFFFLIGLEIKREFLIGELNSTKKVMFPLFGALGGIALPVILYLVLNQNPDTLKGWGIPMATDIAFALAVLKVLGNRVPTSLKIFLTAFAIVDDLGAVLVIAIFYSGDLNLLMLGGALGILVFIYVLSYRGLYSEFVTIIAGFIVWLLFLKAGLHPTLAGILMAFAVPVRQKISTDEFTDQLDSIVKNIKESTILQKPVLSGEQLELIDDLEDWSDKYRSPLQHLEHKLHNWVAYLVIPIFALANAGVAINGEGGLETALVVNIMICLILGKSIGISTVIFAARKLKLIDVPSDITNRQIVGVSFLAGIGFTMAIFIAGLAFNSSPEYIDSAKIGILIGSFISAILGYGILRFNSVKGKFGPAPKA